ncbi:UDP-N-acetylmuramoylalanyl-D-glutamate--2,6-diaminopimelate ligase [Actinokineospora alba]|uniref:UDP-N-acetylmuramoyl-L-alanyl-D-glutamate--2,6-diaminopimelate ligase n=1 Tax=Actinokineospora alba TaxID=504798 RepID=A0A1H0MPH6_9PSEU|nr:UDP-N-acetylmuramoyl-L-alanyl-D-glutamate--2,6-diaminopimelate ligase [Actinokineospora alba]TDP68384.1 UDP-N-acetylmuramoylalanyl-D-glutamate--2,6-diaminopimelate ligase [Actinokineospora alba]SDH77911.1 UDP-N-acetylmuramoyl-L-alanyl-D-glutamate--2,6-diaminopimelate ligase [Actinokineospora alba]SDO82338.1 UDP-N-acetylmuramoylalanyl-D-glutamate--2,6-diaminopimelate ligase [Actinokineospora alba]
MPAKLEGKAVTAPPRPSHTDPVALSSLAEASAARLIARSPETTVTGATLRAQHVRHGDLFAALPGARVHGADFAADAIAAGAAAVLTDEAGAARPAVRDSGLPVLVHDDPRAALGPIAAMIYGNPSAKLAIIGVTGTSGKTTTSYMIESGLAAAGHTTGLIGTVETRIAGERLASAFTTPEAPDLQALLAVMVERGVTHVPMEVSSHALALGRAAGTKFAVGAFTNLSQDHLDFHPDMEDYFQTKALLFDGRSAREVVCVDSEWGRRLVTPETVTVSTTGDADWTASDAHTSLSGEQSFYIHTPDGAKVAATLPMPGTFNIANALVAAACLSAAGVGIDAIVSGLSTVQVPGRMERVDLGQDFTAVVDYSHKPEAVALALDAIKARSDGKVIVVLGCGGDRDTAKRPVMGAEAARRSDLLVVTDDNPRSEDPAAIRAAMLAGAESVPEAERGEVVVIGDRRQAIATAVARAGSGDVVVVAGKGHETGQEIAGVVHPFSDRDELAAAIRSRGVRT